MAGYIGVQPVPQATQRRNSFTATANQTTFATSGYTPGFIDVYMNGVKLAAADFTATNGSDVVLASGAAVSDIVETVSFLPFQLVNPTFDTPVTFKSGSVNVGHIDSDSDNLVIKSLVSDKDIIFKGIDNGVERTALILDMSNSGVANFGSGVKSPGYFWMTVDGNVALYAGTNFEIALTHVHNTGFKLTNGGTGTPAVELQFVDANESIGSDGTDLTLKSGSDIILDATDNVGIGTNSPYELLHVKVGASGQSSASRDGIVIESNGHMGLNLLTTSAHSANIVFGDENDNDVGMIRYLHGSDDMTFTTGGSERMRIDSSGNVGIGVNDPDATLDISGGTNKLGILRVVQRVSGAGAYGLDIGLDPSTGDPVFSRIVNDTVTQVFRIQRSTGSIGVNRSPAPSVKLDVEATGNNHPARLKSDAANYGTVFDNIAGSGTRFFADFRINNSTKGSITSTGGNASFNTSSDYRLKENVVTEWDATTRLKQLKPSRFNWKEDKDTTVDGFLAHEVSGIIPEAVTGTKDAVDKDGNPEYQGIDQSKLVPLLTKALQEAVAKIETLEAKVTALEGK